MSSPAVEAAMRKLVAIGKPVVEQTGRDCLADLQKSVSIPAASKADASFIISSAPGEPPRLRTGKLRGGMSVAFGVKPPLYFYFTIRSATPYGKYLESGTRNMAARPHLKPMRVKWGRILKERLTAAYRGAKS